MTRENERDMIDMIHTRTIQGVARTIQGVTRSPVDYPPLLSGISIGHPLDGSGIFMYILFIFIAWQLWYSIQNPRRFNQHRFGVTFPKQRRAFAILGEVFAHQRGTNFVF